MKVIVFGGSGFLGSHVADVLSARGFKVTIYDRKKSPYLQPSQNMVVADILDEKKLREALYGHEVVYNFAGISDIAEASRVPLDSVKYNVLGNTMILEACREFKVRRFVFASSLYVYSHAGSFYRSTKQACELLIENYQEIFGVPYTILRYGSLYGPRADENNFVFKTLKQALDKGKIIREGDGEEIREYIHVEDAARLSVDILSDKFTNEYAILSGQQPIKVKDLLLMIREMMENKVSIEYTKPDSHLHYEMTPYTFSPRLAKRVVGNTYVDLGQGILKCLEQIYAESKR